MKTYTYTIVEVVGQSMLVRFSYGPGDESLVATPLPSSEAELPRLLHRYAPQPAGWAPMMPATGRHLPSAGTSGQLVWPTGEEPTLEAAKRAKLQELSMWRLGQELCGYTINGEVYETHPTARLELKLAAQKGKGRRVKMRGNRTKLVTPKQLKDIDDALDVHFDNLDAIQADVQTRIEAAHSEAELAAIQLP